MPDGDGTAVHVDGGGTTLNDNTNRALPAQMYDALLTMADRPVKRHGKRQAAAEAMDMVVYRRPSDGTGEEPVDFVPLLPASRDSDRGGGGGRIRVNVSIGGSADGAVYAVSLSLPEPEAVRVPARPPSPPFPSALAGGGGGGTECECYCPCLEPDDDGDRNSTAVADVAYSTTTTTTAFRQSDTTIGATDDDDTDGWTTSVPTSTAVGPETCPPPVLMFCETGELHVPIGGRA